MKKVFIIGILLILILIAIILLLIYKPNNSKQEISSIIPENAKEVDFINLKQNENIYFVLQLSATKSNFRDEYKKNNFFPSVYLVDPDGKIYYQDSDYDNLIKITLGEYACIKNAKKGQWKLYYDPQYANKGFFIQAFKWNINTSKDTVVNIGPYLCNITL